MNDDWVALVPTVTIGITFTALGLGKVYGLARGIIGGGDKPLTNRVCGTCPSWSRRVNLAAIGALLIVGVTSLTCAAFVVWR